MGRLVVDVMGRVKEGTMAKWMRTAMMLAVLGSLVAACGDNDNGSGNANGNDNGGGGPSPTPIVSPTRNVSPTTNATPVGSATAPPQIPCPQLVTYEVVASQSDLDTGWTGVYGGGLPICTINRVAGPVTGTLSPELGSGDSNFPLELTFFQGIEIDRPCPTCSGDGLGATGVCDGGPRNGQACTVHGTGVLG